LKPLRNPIRFLAAFAVGLCLLGARPVASHAESLSFIRDAEIEQILRTYATPLFEAAGLDPSAVEIYLVNDKRINAFVAGGQKLFINTGLLLQSESANQVIGVIAHEVGHIQGAHLARTHDAIRNATAESILSMVLGAAAAIASGSPEIAGAVIAGGSETGLRSFLRYSRSQESAADAAAMRLLDSTGQSANGLLGFLGKLEDQELLAVGRQDPYLRSHPIARDRITALEDFVRRSKHSTAAARPQFEAQHRRMLAKLVAFLEGPDVTFRRYPENDTSLEARYAHAIAWYRKPDLNRALPAIDGLLADYPADPYFHELKGQTLFENGRPTDALGPYETAVSLLPGVGPLRIDLARVQLALNDPALLDAAIRNLRSGLAVEPRNAFAWRQLAIAYGRNGQEGESALALAEEALLRGRAEEARHHADKAQRQLKRGSPGWLQAQDILQQAKRRQN
jgi:predicted Zn-dependent protease